MLWYVSLWFGDAFVTPPLTKRFLQNLRWSFGFNTRVPNAVQSLATPKRNALFYVSSHTGVIHDTENDMQYLLQGHVREWAYGLWL